MGSWFVGVTMLVTVAACLPDDLVPCGDGRLCPSGTACDLAHATCVTPAQTTSCSSLVDGDPCNANGDLGICDDSVCLPGCGDGEKDPLEECDDGNFASHDGCSSSCVREQLGWTRWISPWSPRGSQVAGYLAARGMLVVLGGTQGSGLVDDQWQRDDAGNWTRFTGARPPARRNAAMAYDAARARLVLFGGADAQGNALGDTWEFDGTVWLARSDVASPPARAGPAMTYDPSRGRVVMFGGAGAIAYDETWEYDGTTWVRIAIATPPLARIGHQMVWDATRLRIVMFGGSYGLIPAADTWEYTAGTWTLVNTSPAPSARGYHAMAYSPMIGKVVLFGGAFGAPSSDTWQYGATGWRQVTTSRYSPPARMNASMTLDGSGSLILIGGSDGIGDPLRDVWQYTTAGEWIEQRPQLDPGARTSPLVFDTTTRTSLLATGLGGSASDSDTWSFDGQEWQQGQDVVASRFFHSLAYDEARHRAVLFGGRGPGFLNVADTFERDSATGTWQVVAPPSAPSPRSDSAMGYDPSSQRVVLFGGVGDPSTALDETWEYDGTTWSHITPVESPPGQLQPSIAYDRRNARMVLFALDGETWTYKDHAWSRLLAVSAGGPVARDATSLAYDAVRGRVILFGGAASEYLADVWELANDGWHSLDIVGEAPAPRSRAGLTYDLARHALLLSGGTNSTGNFDDTWTLEYHSITPDELCSNGVDDDGDLHIDAADPDCN